MPMVPPALPVLMQFASPSVRANWGAPKPFEFSLYFVKGEGRNVWGSGGSPSHVASNSSEVSLSLSPILSATTLYALSVSDCVLGLLNLCRSM